MMLDTEFTHDNSPIIGVDVAVSRLPGCHTEYDVGSQPSKQTINASVTTVQWMAPSEVKAV